MEEILMSLHDTVKHMRELLASISVDLEKAAAGNKAASQRVRTGTIRLEKMAKVYRKESIHAEKTGAHPKRHAAKKQPAKKAKAHKAAKPAAKSAAKHAKPAAKHAKVKANPRAKAVHHAQKRPMMMKRATAKIPVKKA